MNIFILNGSPVPKGNTAALIDAFADGARSAGGHIETCRAAVLKLRSAGCTGCRACQKKEAYECVVSDDGLPVLRKMRSADVIVFASPLYFYGASAQLKCLVDRMFSLFKFDNANGTMTTPLKGKTLVFLGSAFENIGLDFFEQPFRMTADYAGMSYRSLVVADAGTSGELLTRHPDAKDKAAALGRDVAR